MYGGRTRFFYAIVDQLQRLGRQAREDIDADILRRLVAVEVAEHGERYNSFILSGERENFASNIAQPRVWVGMIAAQAVARIKNVTVVIIPHEGAPQVFRPEDATEVIVLGNEVDWHFHSFVPNRGEMGKVSNQNLLGIINNTAYLDATLLHPNINPSLSLLRADISINIIVDLISAYCSSGSNQRNLVADTLVSMGIFAMMQSRGCVRKDCVNKTSQNRMPS